MRIWMVSIAVIVGVIVSGELLASGFNDSILVVHSYPKGQWYDGLVTGINDGLKDSQNRISIINYVINYDDYKRVHALSDIQSNELSNLINSNGIKNVIVCDDEAYEVAMPILSTMSVNVFFTGINKDVEELKYFRDGGSQADITGVLERFPFAMSLKLLNKLSPRTKRIAVLTSNKRSSIIILNQLMSFMSDGKNKHYGVSVGKVFVSDEWDDWKRAIMEINNSYDAVWLLVPYDIYLPNGELVDLKQMSQWLEGHLKKPSIGIIDISVDMGLLASISVTPYLLGNEVARMVRRYYSGVPINKINIKEMDRYEIGINKSRADYLNITIPFELLEYAKILKKTEMKYSY